MSTTKTCPQCGAEYAADQRFCARDGAALRGEASNGSLVGEVLADRYLVQERLGEGGMGEVYRAEHVRMRRPCAVKVLRPAVAADPDAVSRFNREAANASRVAHPNVAAVYDFGETAEGLIYLAMELVDGRALRALLDDVGALPPARALSIVAQVAAALDAAHALGIVHRDLKPDNVMLARPADGADVVKVVDFGIAKGGDAAAQQVTRTGLIVGTPEFMSPEQLAGDPVDARSDVYALALLAYAMLTGAHPFPAETVQDTLVLRLTTEPRRLADLRPDVPWPTAVQAVLDRGLARRAAERTASAGELARELTAAYESAASGVSAAATSSEAATQILAASTFAVPPTRVAPARESAPSASATRRRSPAVLAAAGLGIAVMLGAAAWRVRGDDAPVASPETLAVAESAAVAADPDTAAARTLEPAAPPPAPAGRAPTPLVTAASTPAAPIGPRAPRHDEEQSDALERAASDAADRDAELELAAIERLIESGTMDTIRIAAALRSTQRLADAAPPSTPRWYRARIDGALLTYMLRDGQVDDRWCERVRAMPRSAASAVPSNTLRTSLELLRQACADAPPSGVSRP